MADHPTSPPCQALFKAQLEISRSKGCIAGPFWLPEMAVPGASELLHLLPLHPWSFFFPGATGPVTHGLGGLNIGEQNYIPAQFLLRLQSNHTYLAV